MEEWAKTDPEGEKTQQSMITSVHQSRVISEKPHFKVKIKVRSNYTRSPPFALQADLGVFTRWGLF